MNEFEKLGLDEAILKVIVVEKFEKPSDIQVKAIPLILEGKDVMAVSATGSGKTLAFAAGIIHDAKRGAGIQALILTPTRELAEQVSDSFKTFSQFKKLRILPVYGGVSISAQIQGLKQADVVIATPGRVLDHIQRKTIDLSLVSTLVFDEADRMLDMGFIDDVKKITTKCPKKRQTLLFSATLSKKVYSLAKGYMNNPESVSVESRVDPTKLSQCFYDVQDNLKFSLLVHLLKTEKSGLVMVFCNTQRNTDFVAKNIKMQGLDASAIHGGLTQDKRTRIMKNFNSSDVHVLVCTDVAARGLDIKGVSHVYNYDVPNESDNYIHRIGRTARAGKEGKAITILASRDYGNFRKVLSDTGVKVVKEDVPAVERVKLTVPVSSDSGSGRGGFGGNRGSSGFGGRGGSGSGGRSSSGFSGRSGSGFSGRGGSSSGGRSSSGFSGRGGSGSGGRSSSGFGGRGGSGSSSGGYGAKKTGFGGNNNRKSSGAGKSFQKD
ncbi:MAG: DEAD/DEAH box helicase [DPANN group archaeon]|nr:DEAD/DEAH box helicase [DPANN group archaeon]